MDSERPIIIAYAGSLAWFTPRERSGSSFIKSWLWTYNHLASDPSTRSPFYLFNALQLLKRKYGIGPGKIQIHLWGSIHPEISRQADKLGIGDLVKIDVYIPKMKSYDKLLQSDILFLPLESKTAESMPLFIPGKLFEYLKTGKPILALAGESDCTDILKRSGLGIIIEPDNPEKIAKTLASFVAGHSLLKQYKPDVDFINNFSFKNITGKLAGIFDELLKT